MADVRTDPHQERLVRFLAALCAMLPALMAISVLIGWETGLVALTRWGPGSPRILPNSALLIGLGGVSLAALMAVEQWTPGSVRGRAFAGGMAGLGALGGFLMLLEHAGLAVPGMDTVLFPDRVAALGMSFPGRSSPHSSLAIALACLGILLRAAAVSRFETAGARASDGISLLGLLTAYLGLQGVIFGVAPLHSTPSAGMSAPMAVAIASIAAGCILSCRSRGQAWLTTPRPGGVVLRRLLPAALFAPPLIGWLSLEGERWGLFRANVGFVILTTSMAVVTVGLVGWIATTVDRSAAHQEAYQDEVTASEARIRGLIESAPDGMVVVSHDGTIRFVNSRLEHMFRYRRDQLLGQPIELLVPEHRRDAHRAHRARYVEQPACRPAGIGMILQGRRSGGELFEVEISLSPVRRANAIETLAVVRDMTERRKTESAHAARDLETARLRELAALKDHVLSSLSHEVKTPLSLILGYAELLEEDHPADFRIEGILDGCKRLSAHINALLDYSALAAGSLPLYRTEVVLPELIRLAIESWSPTIRSSGVRFETTISPSVPPVEGDTRRIAEVLDILLDNAFKFTPAGGVVRVETFPCGDLSCFRVVDSGPGIDPSIVDRIWEPFGKAQIGKGGPGGLGLGLALARKLVEAHGGVLDLHTERGRGCAFTVQLPASKRFD